MHRTVVNSKVIRNSKLMRSGYRHKSSRLLAAVLFAALASCAQIGSNGTVDAEFKDNAKIRSMLSDAKRAEDAGDIELAKSIYEAMMDSGAKASRSLNHYAIFLRKQLEIDQAENVYLRALKYSPRDATTHYNLGILYELYRGDFSKAKQHYESYQANAEEADPAVKNWIVDLERRIASGESGGES